MILGLLADTHDQGAAMVAGLAALRDGGAQFYIHCGDVGSPSMLDHLSGLPCAFIFGNNDYERMAIARYAAEIEVPCYGSFADLTLDGKRLAVIHGDDVPLKRRLLLSQEYDYLVQGHTHLRLDERKGRTRLINPGALYRANPKSVATLDTASDQLKFLDVRL